MARNTNLKANKILSLLVCVAFLFYGLSSVLAQSSTIVNAQASSNQSQVGSIITVTLEISNVQNLAGIDSTLQWNPSILTLTTVVLNLGDSHSNGVLHGSNLNYDPDNLQSGDIYVSETKVSGSYNLVAQSIGQSNPGFTGSGTIATLTFNVIKVGQAGLSLQTDLADHPPTGQIANNILHQDIADSVTVVTPGSSSSPISTTTPTNSASQTPTPSQSQSPSVSPSPTTIPGNSFQIEYLFAIVGVAVVIIAVLVVFIMRKRK
jgi:hypothetical protein